MACIYKARDRKTGQTVAIKVPLHAHARAISPAPPASSARRHIGKSLNHPSVLKIIPVEEQKSRPYIVMEFLEGRTLADLLKETKPLPEADAVAIASRICDALDYLHRQNVVHRDLKPQNIMLCGDGSIRIMDFGIAKSAQARRMTFVGFTPAMGTPDYMAPEQVQGKRGDERTDIYSLGAILYEMATGATLFEGENPYVGHEFPTHRRPSRPAQNQPQTHTGAGGDHPSCHRAQPGRPFPFRRRHESRAGRLRESADDRALAAPPTPAIVENALPTFAPDRRHCRAGHSAFLPHLFVAQIQIPRPSPLTFDLAHG